MGKTIKSLTYNRFVKACFVTLSCCLIILTLLALLNPLDNRGVESNVVYFFERINLNKKFLYTNPALPPFAVNQYPPLYYLFGHFVLSYFAGASYHETQIALRIISFLFELAGLIFFYLILTKQLKIGREEALVCTIFFAIASYPWYLLSRPDAMVMFFYFTSLSYVFKYIDNQSYKCLLFAGAFSVLAILSKHNAVVMIVASSLFFIVCKNLKSLVFFYAGVVATFLLVGIIYWLSNYPFHFLYDNLVLGVKNGISLSNFLFKTLKDSFEYFGIFILLAVFFLFVQNKKDKNVQLLKLVVITSLFFSTAGGLKRGSAHSYFIECLGFCIFLVVYSVRRLDINVSLPSKYQRLLLLFMIANSFVIFYLLVVNSGIASFKAIRSKHITDGRADAIIAKLKDEKKDFFFFSSVNEITCALPDKCIFPQEDVFICCAIPLHTYDYKKSLDSLVTTGKFELIIQKGTLQPELFNTSIINQFSPVDTIEGYIRYRNVNSN